jgi:hypothetical protein
MFESQTGGFKRASEAEAQAAYDELNAPLPGDFTVYGIGDPLDALPGEASRAKLVALRQRAQDARALLLPLSDELRETRLEKQRADVRLAQLKLRRGEGGPDLSDDEPQVRDVRLKIDKLDADIVRLSALQEHRSARLSAVGLLVRACDDFLRTRRGQLVEAPAIDVADVLRKGERLSDGIERLRMRAREIDADAHRIRSAPYPSADVKQRLREQLDGLANRGTPDVSGLIEHNAELGWPMAMVRLPLVAITEKGERITGSAQGDVLDTLAMFAWLHRPALLKALEALIESEADDQCALSAHDRAVKLAEIARDKLATERQEAALVWAAQQAGDNVEHRDIDPRPLLNIEFLRPE